METCFRQRVPQQNKLTKVFRKEEQYPRKLFEYSVFVKTQIICPSLRFQNDQITFIKSIICNEKKTEINQAECKHFYKLLQEIEEPHSKTY